METNGVIVWLHSTCRRVVHCAGCVTVVQVTHQLSQRDSALRENHVIVFYDYGKRMPFSFYKRLTNLRLSAINRIAEKSLFIESQSTTWIKPWDSTRSPPYCIMCSVAAYVNYVSTVKNTQQLRRLVHNLFFSHVQSANHSTITGVGPWHKNIGRPWMKPYPRAICRRVISDSYSRWTPRTD